MPPLVDNAGTDKTKKKVDDVVQVTSCCLGAAGARSGTAISSPDGGRHQFCGGAPSARPSGEAALRRRQCHPGSEMLPTEHMRRLPRYPALRFGRMAHGRCHGVPSRAWAAHAGRLHDAK